MKINFVKISNVTRNTNVLTLSVKIENINIIMIFAVFLSLNVSIARVM